MVGMQGFEPWTSRSRSVRATKLRYIPIWVVPMTGLEPATYRLRIDCSTN
jgi:hypothetical protein